MARITGENRSGMNGDAFRTGSPNGWLSCSYRRTM